LLAARQRSTVLQRAFEYDSHLYFTQDEPAEASPSDTPAPVVGPGKFSSRLDDLGGRQRRLQPLRLGYADNGGIGGRDEEWYGLNQYFLYKLNPCWDLNLRFEWFRDDDGTKDNKFTFAMDLNISY